MIIMASVSNAIKAKSDQLNYDDIGNKTMIILITEVRVTETEQPVTIFYQGCGNKPYKPAKTMIRLISDAWGDESDNWIGKSLELYGDDSVKWAGAAIGGIRVKSMSDIAKGGFSAFIAISRGKRRKATIPLLEVAKQQLTATADDLAWIEAINKDPSVIDQLNDNMEYKLRIQSLIDSL